MRLTPTQKKTIREEVARTFGKNASVRLFGSRTDDNARGGDIDLYIEANGTPAELLDAELALQASLQRRLGDRRIDIVVHGRNQPMRSIDEHARQTGVRL